MQNEIENAECRIDNRVIFWVVFCFTPDLRQNGRKFQLDGWTIYIDQAKSRSGERAIFNELPAVPSYVGMTV